MKRSKLALALTVIYAAALFWVNHVPLEGVDLAGFGGDKVAHFVAYSGLAVLLAFTFFPDRRGSWLGYRWLLGMAAVYGLADELLQILVPSRSCDVWDLAADCLGATGGLATHALLAPAVGRLLLPRMFRTETS